MQTMVEIFVYFVLKSITRKLKISLNNNVNMFYVTMLSCTNIKFKLVVHTKICTTENYPLYGICFCAAGRSHRVNVRAESFNTGVRTKPLLLSNVGRSSSMDKRPVIKSPLIPSREHSVSTLVESP